MKSPIVRVSYSNAGDIICAGTQHGNVDVFYLTVPQIQISTAV